MGVDQYIVRPFEAKDREAIRSICRRTGQRGNPTQVYFEDEEFTPMLYADYYMDDEPEACFVAEADGEVIGYVLGCKDTRRYNRVLLTRIIPRMVLRGVRRILTLQYREKKTYWALWWALTRGWYETPHPPIDLYPAHYHVNILSGHRSQKLGTTLGLAWYQHLLDHGVKGVHAITLEEEGDETLSTLLCQKWGYRLEAVKRHTLWEKTTGKKWYAKLLVWDVQPDILKSSGASPYLESVPK